MGSTVTTGKRVAAFKAASGTIYYALFEQTYEKNVRPHTPDWHCVSFGTIDTVMQRIFGRASSCEGGMLQNRNGWITPEGYIGGWLKALAAPGELPNFDVRIEVGTSFYSVITDSTRDAAMALLASNGRQDIVAALSAEQTVKLSLYEHAELLAALHTEAGIAPWRLFSAAWAEHYPLPRPELGYAPAPAKSFAVDVPKFLKVGDDSRLVQQPDGAWRCMGSEYAIIGGFVADLWESEIREPGSYRKRIKAFREATQSSLPIPEGTKVHVDLSVPLEHEYQRRQVYELRHTGPSRSTAHGYEIDVNADRLVTWELTHLPAECTTWLLPAASDSEPEDALQMSLLVA